MKLGTVPRQQADTRDLLWSASASAPLPPGRMIKADPVRDQGPLSSCTAFAALAAAGALELSPLYVYRKTTGKYSEPPEDGGAYVRDAIKSVMKGAPVEAAWPYSTTPWNASTPVPDPPLVKPIGGYRSLTVGNIKQSIVEGRPVVFAYDCDESIMHTKVRFVKPTGPTSFSHAMAIMGYSKDMYYVQNSWGTKWGVGGFAWMPLVLLQKYGRDFWSIMRA